MSSVAILAEITRSIDDAALAGAARQLEDARLAELVRALPDEIVVEVLRIGLTLRRRRRRRRARAWEAPRPCVPDVQTSAVPEEEAPPTVPAPVADPAPEEAAPPTVRSATVVKSAARPVWRPVPKPRASTPPAAALHLPVVRVDELVALGQRFRCVPYSAVIAARMCIERQQLHGEAARTTSTGNALERRNFGKCASCELGRGVAARLGEVVPVRAAPPPPRPHRGGRAWRLEVVPGQVFGHYEVLRPAESSVASGATRATVRCTRCGRELVRRMTDLMGHGGMRGHQGCRGRGGTDESRGAEATPASSPDETATEAQAT